MSEDWKFYWGNGEQPETLNGPEETREAAAAEAIANSEPGEVVSVCEARPMTLDNRIFDADWIVERFDSRNEEKQNEDGDCLLEDATDEQLTELEGILNDAFVAWRAKHGVGRAYMLDTRNEEVLTVPEPAGEPVS